MKRRILTMVATLGFCLGWRCAGAPSGNRSEVQHPIDFAAGETKLAITVSDLKQSVFAESAYGKNNAIVLRRFDSQRPEGSPSVKVFKRYS